MNAHELTILLLGETNPPVAAVVRCVGSNLAGWPLPGLLGWLPRADRLDLCRAVLLAHDTVGTPHSWDGDAADMADVIYLDGGWRMPCPEDRPRIDKAVIAWASGDGRGPRRIPCGPADNPVDH
jgi:hypothetical protein